MVRIVEVRLRVSGGRKGIPGIYDRDWRAPVSDPAGDFSKGKGGNYDLFDFDKEKKR